LEKDRYDVFLSHASSDKPVVEELARLLTLRGLRPWLDKWDLVPGEPWQEAIEKALADCPACAVCIGAGGFGGWQTEEMNGAIQLQVGRERRRVIPVLLPGAERGERSALPLFLQGRTWVDFHGSLNEERVLRRLVRGIRGERPGPDSEDAVAEGICPYWGLDYFDVGDSAFFHGREDLTGSSPSSVPRTSTTASSPSWDLRGAARARSPAPVCSAPSSTARSRGATSGASPSAGRGSSRSRAWRWRSARTIPRPRSAT
jgi:hypothetical protein